MVRFLARARDSATALAARLWPARPDLVLHVVGGVGVACVAIVAAWALGASLEAQVLAGVASAAIAGVAKEAWDSRGHGTVDALDAAATVAGGVAAALVRWVST